MQGFTRAFEARMPQDRRAQSQISSRASDLSKTQETRNILDPRALPQGFRVYGLGENASPSLIAMDALQGQRLTRGTGGLGLRVQC